MGQCNGKCGKWCTCGKWNCEHQVVYHTFCHKKLAFEGECTLCGLHHLLPLQVLEEAMSRGNLHGLGIDTLRSIMP